MYPTRLVVALIVCALSGCKWYVLNHGGERERDDLYAEMIAAKTGDARKAEDCARGVQGVNSLREDLRVWWRGIRTPYHVEINFWWDLCLRQGDEGLKRPGSEVAALRAAITKIDLALSMPTATEPSSVQATTKLRGELADKIAAAEQRHAAQLALQTKLIELATRADSRGWHLAALGAWAALAPTDEATHQRKRDAITRLAPLAHAHVAVPVAVVAAPQNGASPAILAAVRARPELVDHPGLRFVDAPTQARIVASLAVAASKHDRQNDTLPQEWSYVSGMTEVPNPQLERLRKELATNEKEAVYWDKKAASVRCSDPPCKSAIAHRDNATRHRERAARNRADLQREKPTVRREIRSTWPFTANRVVVRASTELAVTLSFGGTADKPLTGTARVERTALSFPANPQVKLLARNDRIPEAAELEAALATEAIRQLVNGVGMAPARASRELEGKAASTTDPLERLQHVATRALRTAQPSDVEAARQQMVTLFGTAIEWVTLQQALRGREAR